MTDNATIATALEEAFGEHLFEADGLVRFPLLDLLPDGMLDEENPDDEGRILVMDSLDVRTDVSTRCTFAGSLEEPPEYAMFGDWAVLDQGHVVASGRVLDEGEWEGDPFFFLRDRK